MGKIFIPSHSEGCQIAAKFLHKQMNCGAVFVEPNSFDNRESPDAIGFRPGGCSILMEVKVSRADFLTDKKKPHRMNPSIGMGAYRFYVCPADVIKIEDLPPKWGLLYFTPRKSLKPVHVPNMQYSSLSSPEHYASYLSKSLGKRRPTDIPPYLLGYKQMLEEFAHFERNQVAEQNILYGAWRQLCIAQSRGVDYNVTEVFQRPNI
ncbi:hypothetical protein [Salmonella phage SPTD1]|uniref:Uncharacterized protein n=4 Tax=Caudoviricetes TaxID=2731619 RepID=A0A1X9I907_9CAUD|nr:hypothetical protein DET7_76 [Salmonella phage Det7]YP_009948809.1 hypothetical protein HYQ25_gp008 [Salmonella phage Se-B]YP_009966558.1 hypothetical protein HYQ26_gp045 [Salmonella phage Se-G]ANT44532.1 hypothetical protein vB_SenM-2_073 [Salmonella phage vB_SenM-2]QFR58732.1 hypothetical protein Phi10_086 [Salmonella phage vB_SentM_Phi_10]WBL99135.1 hypothetical protein [Salmonella phage SPTD1]WDS51393.1 hypothetical protein SeF6a_075 [Salmonella phage SeF6a]WPJ70506.1 hypothetical pro